MKYLNIDFNAALSNSFKKKHFDNIFRDMEDFHFQFELANKMAYDLNKLEDYRKHENYDFTINKKIYEYEDAPEATFFTISSSLDIYDTLHPSLITYLDEQTFIEYFIDEASEIDDSANLIRYDDKFLEYKKRNNTKGTYPVVLLKENENTYYGAVIALNYNKKTFNHYEINITNWQVACLESPSHVKLDHIAKIKKEDIVKFDGYILNDDFEVIKQRFNILSIRINLGW